MTSHILHTKADRFLVNVQSVVVHVVSEEPPRLFSESATAEFSLCNTSCSSSTQHSNNTEGLAYPSLRASPGPVCGSGRCMLTLCCRLLSDIGSPFFSEYGTDPDVERLGQDSAPFPPVIPAVARINKHPHLLMIITSIALKSLPKTRPIRFGKCTLTEWPATPQLADHLAIANGRSPGPHVVRHLVQQQQAR
jgi:hypothetical protein